MKIKFPSPTRRHPTTSRHTHPPTHYALLAQGAHRVTTHKHSTHAHTSSLLQTLISYFTHIVFCVDVIISNFEKQHKHTHTPLKNKTVTEYWVSNISSTLSRNFKNKHDPNRLYRNNKKWKKVFRTNRPSKFSQKMIRYWDCFELLLS